MTAEVIQFVPRPNPNRPQPESLLGQATSLVGFINALTAKDPVEFNAALPVYTETNSFTAPEKDPA